MLVSPYLLHYKYFCAPDTRHLYVPLNNKYMCATAYLSYFNTSYKYFRFPVYNRYFAPPVYCRYFRPGLLQIFCAPVYYRYFAPLFTTDILRPCLLQIFMQPASCYVSSETGGTKLRSQREFNFRRFGISLKPLQASPATFFWLGFIFFNLNLSLG